MSRRLGAVAEAQAAAHLERLGYRILARNVTVRGGELDLVAMHRGTLCFVEVRARASARHGAAEETVGPTKRRRLLHAARTYLASRPESDIPCRFDVVAVGPDGIRVIEDAFDAAGQP
jgi:putative endonuclease